MTGFSDKSKIRTQPNYLYAILSVALVLFLLGFFGLLIAHAQALVTSFKENVVVLLEIKNESAKEDVALLQEKLSTRKYIKAGSLKYTDKKQAAQEMRSEFGEDFLKLDMPNPFYDVIAFNVNSAYVNSDSLLNIKGGLKDEKVVNDIFYQENLVDNIEANVKKMSWIALGIGLFFIFVAITLIHNTIRLALYANRFLIKNMQLVGATWEFISRPYIFRAMKHGLISAIIAGGFLALMLYFAKLNLPTLEALQDWTLFGLLFALLLILGVLINTISTHFVVKKYLKMRVDDLY